jgi:hypothetical protein
MEKAVADLLRPEHLRQAAALWGALVETDRKENQARFFNLVRANVQEGVSWLRSDLLGN